MPATTPPPRRLVYRTGQAAVRGFGHLFYGYGCEGVAHVPPTGACLIAANHKSFLDPPFVGACLPREIRYFAKKELFRVPLLGPLIRLYGSIPVDREGFDRKGVTLALELLERGEALLVFPEGTRIRRCGFAEPKEGIGLLALRTGAPIVPAFIRSSWDPRRRLLRRIPVHIRFGPPLRFERMEPGPAARARYAGISREVMDAIRRLSPPVSLSVAPE